MRARAVPLGVLFALLLAAPASAQQPVCADADRPPVRTDYSRIAAAVLCIVNAERTTRGLGPLFWEPRLGAGAQGHSADMARRGYFAHNSPEGTGPGERATAAGYPWAYVGENIAAGQDTPREAMESWMASVYHCQGVLSPYAAELGVGLAFRGRRPYWTQLFGRRQEHGPPRPGWRAPPAAAPTTTSRSSPGRRGCSSDPWPAAAGRSGWAACSRARAPGGR